MSPRPERILAATLLAVTVTLSPAPVASATDMRGDVDRPGPPPVVLPLGPGDEAVPMPQVRPGPDPVPMPRVDSAAEPVPMPHAGPSSLRSLRLVHHWEGQHDASGPGS